MLTRSLSYYTLSKPAGHSQLDLLSADPAQPASVSSGLAQPAGMPRSISLNKINYAASSSTAASPSSTHSTPFASHAAFQHSRKSSNLGNLGNLAAFPLSARGRAATASTTTLELMDDEAKTTGLTPPSPADADQLPLPAAVPVPAKVGAWKPKARAERTQPANARIDSPPIPSPRIVPSSTSPEGFLTTEAGSLPALSFHTTPSVGHALMHPPGDASLDDDLTRGLPAALLEDFEIVGRAGDPTATCDSWIVRSKCSGKMAVFKPRDGEAFEQRRAFEVEQEAKREREERLNRLAARGGPGSKTTDVAPLLSSSCPHPLSLPTHVRTPLKRGVVYGDTTRKEVAAYLLDHEHFAGVPKTLEATIWLAAHDAPNKGQNIGPGGVMNFHPYLHAGAQRAALPAGGGLPQLQAPSPHFGPASPASVSPDMLPQSNPLLLMASSQSPPLGAVAAEPQFQFDEEEWMPAPAAAAHHTGGDGSERSLFGARSGAGSEADDFGAQTRHLLSPPSANSHHHNNLHPPSLLSAGGGATPSPPSSAAASGPASVLSSPEFLSTTAGTTPDEFRGLGLPASAGELIATYGSLQEFVENAGSAEEMGSNVFAADEVHRIGILDVRLLNLDRHLGNLLVSRDAGGRPHLVPIDHGFILPSYQELSDVHLEWTFWRQCSEPFSKETLRYIARLDPIADAAKLRALGIRDEALVSMVFSSLLLKHAASEGLSLFHIASMVQRDGDGVEPSTLEAIVARVLGSQHAMPDSVSPEAAPFEDVSPDSLPSVTEEELPSPSSRAANMAHASPISSPATSPSRAAAAAFAAAGPAPPPALLTRSNSDGAVALAEAITGRQFSAPAKVRVEPELKRAASGAGGRRPSVADTAKHIMQLVDGTLNSPPQSASAASPNSYSSSESFQLPTPPPPNMLRLGTELTLHDPNRSADANGASDLPSGAKLQMLLDATHQAIVEELNIYRARNGLMPAASPIASTASPTSAASSSTAHHGATSPISSAASPHSAVFNSTIRAPRSPVRGSFVAPTRTLSEPVAAAAAVGTVSSSLLASLQRNRSRSGSVNSNDGSNGHSPQPPVRASYGAYSPSADGGDRRHIDVSPSRAPPIILA